MDEKKSNINDRIHILENQLKHLEKEFSTGKMNYSDYIIQKDSIVNEQHELLKLYGGLRLFNTIKDKELDKVIKRDTVISEDAILNLIIDLETKTFDEIVA